MPNINAPAGLAPVMYRNGAKWNGQARLYAIAAADINAIYVGDPVKVTGAADANGVQVVTLATAGAIMRGVVVSVGVALPYGYQGGPMINPNDLTKTNRPSGAQSQVYFAMVVDDPNVIFEIQEAYTATPTTNAQMAKNANFVYAAPATGVYWSGVTLDQSTLAVTATLNLKILGAVQRLDNTPYTTYQRLLVSINNHDFNAGIVGL
jgi:hypothetical protein